MKAVQIDAYGGSENMVLRDVATPEPGAGEAPVPEGVVSFWSETLGLYLYTQGGWVDLHHPRWGRLNTGGEWEEAWVAEKEARLVAEKAWATEKRARSVAEQAWATEKEVRLAAEQARLVAEQRNTALEAELRDLRRRMG